MSLNILLIRPNLCIRKGFDLQNRFYPPLGLVYLAAALLPEGHHVEILDMVSEAPDTKWEFRGTHVCYGMTDEALAERIADSNPRIIGITGFTSQHARIVEIVSKIKVGFPDITVVLGGIHPTALPNMMMEQSGADFVILGEGETSFTRLASAVETGDQEQIRRIDGLVYRHGERIEINPKTSFSRDLDSIPLPARELLPNTAYLEHEVSMPVITSRGCPYSCVFCCVSLLQGQRWRARSPEHVVDEVELIVNRWGYKTVAMFDDAFNVIPERVERICKEIIRRGLKINVVVPSSLMIKHLTRDTLYWLRQAGCSAVVLPFEHSDEKIRNTIINKGLTTEQFDKVLDWCRELELLAMVNLVIGLPGETEETLQSLDRYVAENAFRMDALTVYIGTPFPGTRFFEECLEKGYLHNPQENDFLDFDLYKCVINTPWLSADTVDRYRQSIENTFTTLRTPHFDNALIRRAVRKPDAEASDYINTVYLKKRLQIGG